MTRDEADSMVSNAFDCTQYEYDREALVDAVHAAFARGRREAIEAAARVCDASAAQLASTGDEHEAAIVRACASDVRALAKGGVGA